MEANTYISTTDDMFELVEMLGKEHYSKEINDIGKDLLLNGCSTIPEIQSRGKLQFENVRNVLIVGLQNKLVNTKEVGRKEVRLIGYEISLDNVLNIGLFPKILHLIKGKFGEYGVMVFEEFIQFGILSAMQVFEQVRNKIETSGKNTGGVIIGKIKNLFLKMIEDNYIIQAQKVSGGNSDGNKKYESTGREKNKNKKNKEKEKEKDKEMYNGFNGTANRSASNNKSKVNKKKGNTKKPIDDAEVDNESNNVEATNGNSKANNTINIPEEYSNPGGFNHDTNQFFFFFFNYDQFLSEFKSQIVIDFISQKLSSQSGLIASFLLEKNQMHSFSTGKSRAETYTSICTRYKTGNANQIEELVQNSNDYFMKVSSDSIVLNLEGISKEIKARTIEKIIQQQFTDNHMRIYRLLSLCGSLDSRNIMDICLLPPKTCNMILNQGYSEEIIQTQIVNVKGSNILFYSVNLNNNIEKVVNMGYKIIKNLKKYIIEEMDAIKNRTSEGMQEQYLTKIYSTISQVCETIIVLKNIN